MNYSRALLNNEQAMELLNLQKGAFNIVTISRIKGDVKEEFLKKALEIVQNNHVLLRCRIIGTLDKLEFTEEGTSQIPLTITSLNNEVNWKNFVEEELNKAINSSECLLRCLLLYNYLDSSTYLITTIHHAISDGLSSVNLHSEILQNYQIISSGESLNTRKNSLIFLPTLEQLLPKWMEGNKAFRKSKIFLLKTKLKILLHKPEQLEAEKVVPLEYRSCGMAHRYLEKRGVQILIELCHKENTTVQGALCAAMLLAVENKIRSQSLRTINVSCRTYVDLRRRLEPPVNHNNMMFLASFILSLHKITPQTSFWDLARDATKQIKISVDKKDMFKPLKMVKEVIQAALKNPDKIPLTAAVTNIGIVNIPNIYGDLKIEEISFIPSNPILGKVFTVAVTTFNEKMILNFTASKPSISQDTIEKLADRVVDYLVEVCKENIK